MATFYRCSNNGVIAVVTEEICWQIEERGRMMDELLAKGYEGEMPSTPKPIFTFVSQARIDAGYGEFHTGSHELMDRLLKEHSVRAGWFYVPFSNHAEYEKGPRGKAERKFRTTLEQAIEAFGLVSKPLEITKKPALPSWLGQR